MGDLYKKILNQLNVCEKYQKKDDRLDRYDRLYGKLKGEYYQGVSSQDRIKVELIAAHTYQQIPNLNFRNPYISVSAKTPKYISDSGESVDNLKNAEFMEAALNQEFDEISIKKEVSAMIQDAVCPYDFGVLKIGYSYATQIDNRGYKDITRDRVWVKRVCPRDVLIDPMSTPLKINKVFHRMWVPLQWVKDNQDFNKSVRQEVNAAGMPQNMKDLGLTQDKVDYNPDLVELFEVHDYENNQIAVFTKGCDDFLINPYDDPYQFRGPHFIFFIPYPLNDDFYGRNMSSLIEPQVDETNKFRTRMIRILKKFPYLIMCTPDAWTKQQRKAWADSEDGEIAEATNPSEIMVHSVPSLSRDFYNMSEIMERDLEKVGMTSSMRRGEVTNVKPTTAQIITGHENIRDMYLRGMVADVYEEVASKIGDLMIQYYDTPRWLKLKGDSKLIEGNPTAPFALYSNQDIMGNYDFKADVNSMVPVNNEVKAQVLLNTTTALLGLGQGNPFAEALLKKYDFEKVTAEIYKMQGVDLLKYERPEIAEAGDAEAENQHALKGGLLKDPIDSEDHREHAMIHKAAADATGNPEIIRHLKITLAHIAEEEAKQPTQASAVTPQATTNVPSIGQGGMTPGQMPTQANMLSNLISQTRNPNAGV